MLDKIYEKNFEDIFCQELKNNGFEELISTKSTYYTEEELKINFKKQLEKFNASVLKEQKLTNSQFKQVEYELFKQEDLFQKAKRLREKLTINIEGQTQKIELSLFNMKDYCHNRFQFVRQLIVGSVNNHTDSYRYDIVLIINGLPLVLIELKKYGSGPKGLEEAFKQIKEKYATNTFRGLLSYFQFFVISNGVNTKYFANNKPDLLNEEYMFSWTDEDNVVYRNIIDFISTFLNKCNVAKMIGRFIVLETTKKKLMILRPYQIHAINKLTDYAESTNNNGYVWHATGSGKTLTSFKLSEILKQTLPDAEIFFLVDRRDLNHQTIEHFKRYTPYDICYLKDKDDVKKKMMDESIPLIVTTIQKMSKICSKKNKEYFAQRYRNKKIIFIIDECHRSQGKKMSDNIKDFFPTAQFLGFTGTPIFKNQKKSDKPNNKTKIYSTDDIFHKCLHYYTLFNAVLDKNVLKWNMNYFEDNDENIKNKTIIKDYSKKEQRKLIVEDILKKHQQINYVDYNKFNAILTVNNVEELIEYYSEFQKQQQQKETNFQIAAIYSEQEEKKNSEKNLIIKKKQSFLFNTLINDYNKSFNKQYGRDDFPVYAHDVATKMKDKKIDILIVVRMFLTGFDSEFIKTLYIANDSLKEHNLIQAFSRTNRLSIKKTYGNILCYNVTKKTADEAIKKFVDANSNNYTNIFVEKYENLTNEFKNSIQTFLDSFSNFETVKNLRSTEEKNFFLKKFKKVYQNFYEIKNRPEFSWQEQDWNLSFADFKNFESESKKIAGELRSERSRKTTNEQFSDDNSSGTNLTSEELSLFFFEEKINVDYLLQLMRNNELEKAKEYINLTPEGKILQPYLEKIQKKEEFKDNEKENKQKQFTNNLLKIIKNPNSGIDFTTLLEDMKNYDKEQKFENELQSFIQNLIPLYPQNDLENKKKTLTNVIKNIKKDYSYYRCSLINKQTLENYEEQILSEEYKLGWLERLKILQQIEEFINKIC